MTRGLRHLIAATALRAGMKHRLAVIAVALLLPAACAPSVEIAQPPGGPQQAVTPGIVNPLLSEAAFTQAFIKTLGERLPDTALQFRRPLSVVLSDRRGLTLNATLDRIYVDYLMDPPALPEILAARVRVLAEAWQDEEPADPERIVPLVKDSGYAAQLEALLARGGPRRWRPPLLVSYSGGLEVFYAEVIEGGLRLLDESALAASGLSAGTRRAMAVANLQRLLPHLKADAIGGFYLLTADGSDGIYETSLMLVNPIWQGGQLPVKGDIVIALPIPDMLFVTGSDDASGLYRLRWTIEEASKIEPEIISDRMFVFRDGRFVVFEP